VRAGCLALWVRHLNRHGFSADPIRRQSSGWDQRLLKRGVGGLQALVAVPAAVGPLPFDQPVHQRTGALAASDDPVIAYKASLLASLGPDSDQARSLRNQIRDSPMARALFRVFEQDPKTLQHTYRKGAAASQPRHLPQHRLARGVGSASALRLCTRGLVDKGLQAPERRVRGPSRAVGRTVPPGWLLRTEARCATGCWLTRCDVHILRGPAPLRSSSTNV